MNETSSKAIYRQVCKGDPTAVTYYLKTADPEDANHGILSYVESLRAEVERLRKIEEVARKLVYVAAPPVSPIRLALGLPALCEALGIDPIEATEKATADEEVAKRRVADARR